MNYFIYPKKDSTIYERFPDLNAGKDEILELRKESAHSSGSYTYSRILIQFDLSNITNIINTENITGNIEYFLNLYSSNASLNVAEYKLDVLPILSSWNEGIGRLYSDIPFTSGVTWKNRDSGINWNVSGSDWIQNVSGSQYFNDSTTDVSVNVTDIVNNWITGSYDNNGFLIKRPDVDELSNVEFGELYFFSNDTHTIYLPTLEMKYSDYKFITGSLLPLSQSANINVIIKNLKPKYKINTKVKFRVLINDLNESRRFDRVNPFNIIKYLNSKIQYSILDTVTNLEIVPFSDYSLLSCDQDGYYFDFYISSLLPERFYKIIFMVCKTDDYTYIDNNVSFKVVL